MPEKVAAQITSEVVRHLRRHRKDNASKPQKTAQMFFCLDGQTEQPLCCTPGTSARTVPQATPEILALAAEILDPVPAGALVAADAEHFTAELIDHVHSQTPFDILTPIAAQRGVQERLRAIPCEQFTPHWAGYAPNAGLLQKHYEDLPEKLKADNVDPRIPWLYGFQLDFRFT